METISTFALVAIALVSALVAAFVTWALMSSGVKGYKAEIQRLKAELDMAGAKLENAAALAQQSEKHYEQRCAQIKEDAEKQLLVLREENREALLRAKAEYEKHLALAKSEHEKHLALTMENNEKAINELKESQKRLLEAARNELALENEKLLKAREESLRAEAAKTMKEVTGSLDKDIRDMKESFEKQREAHISASTSIRTKFDETVKNLSERTEAIGNKAEDLAMALKGKNKMQGNWGETILENLLKQEGFKPGRDYDSEYVLRDKDGNVVSNVDSGKKMRPDFALHFPDDTDVIVDSKVSLTALADYFAAQDEEGRNDASRRNLESVMSHVNELAAKEYQRYVFGRNTLDYTIMFIPNIGAYQLAKQEDPDIFSKAFAKNVLITTEETLLPFLRLIRSAWIQKQQFENMEQIIATAESLVKRVGMFCSENAKLQNQLATAVKTLEENTKRLSGGRQSILKAANDLVALGVRQDSKYALPQSED